MAVAVVFGLAAAAGAVAASQVVQVDCAKSKSVQQAIDGSSAPELVVEITGVCNEDVVITRSDVTLRGLDPNLDGLRGVGANTGGDHAVLLVKGASRIRIENLRIEGGSRFGLMAQSTYNVTVVNAIFLDNLRAGISVTDSTVDATDVVISGSDRGFQVFESGLGACHGCDITAATHALLVVSARGYVDAGSRLEGGVSALLASSNADTAATDSTLTSSSYALLAEDSSQIEITGSTIDGSILSWRDSLMSVRNSAQVADPLGETRIADNSSVSFTGGSTALGPVNLGHFSNLVLAAATIAGDLSCASGSDAFCYDPYLIGGATSGCQRCVKP